MVTQMIKMKQCDQCHKEFDRILPGCPHCLSARDEDFNSMTGDHVKNLQNKPTIPEEKETFSLTPSGDGVQVNLKTAQLHPLFGVSGGLYCYKIALIFCPLLGLFYSLLQSSSLLSFYSVPLVLVCILDSFLFIWAYWLSKELYKYKSSTSKNINKYLIVSSVIAIAIMYMSSKLNVREE